MLEPWGPADSHSRAEFQEPVVVEIVGFALVFGAAVSLWRAKRTLGVVLGGLSLAVTFAASILFLYAFYLPAATSVVVPESENLPHEP